MKKRYFYLATFLTMFPAVASADDASLLQNGLNSYGEMYTNVTVSEDADGLSVKFPDETYTTTVNDDEDQNNAKTVSETVSGYIAKAVKEGSFYDNDVYKITSSSNDALRYDLYQLLPDEPQEIKGMAAPYLKNISADQYITEKYFVPEMKFFSADNIKIQRLVYATVDEESGLKQEIAGIKSFDSETTVVPHEDTIEIKNSSNLQNFSAQLPPIFSFSLREMHGEFSWIYDVTSDTDINELTAGAKRINILKGADISLMKKSDLTGVMKNLSLEVLGIKFAADISNHQSSSVDATDQTMRIDGNYDITNLKIESMFYNLPSGYIKLKYIITGISTKDLSTIVNHGDATLKKIKEAGSTYQLTPEDEQDIREYASLWETAIKDVKLNLDLNIALDQAEIVAPIILERSGNYFIGNADVTIYNYDKLTPDNSQQCEEEQKNNPSSMSWSCLKSDNSGPFDEFIDKSKRTTDAQGRTVDKIKFVFDTTGVYANGNKLDEPLEFDINKEVDEYIQKLKNRPSADILTDVKDTDDLPNEPEDDSSSAGQITNESSSTEIISTTSVTDEAI